MDVDRRNKRKGKGKLASDDEESIKAVGVKENGDGGEDGNKDDLLLSISLSVPQFDSSDENGDGDGRDEDGRSVSLDSQVVWCNSTLQDNKEVDDERNGGLESEEDSEGGGREG